MFGCETRNVVLNSAKRDSHLAHLVPDPRRCKTFIDPPFLFTAGCMFALAIGVGRKPNLWGPAWTGPRLCRVLLVTVSWFTLKAPDWMLCYFIPAAQLPMTTVHLLSLLSLILAVLGGHIMTATFIQRGQRLLTIATPLAGATVWTGLWALTLDRYLLVGTFDEFTSGQAVPLMESSLTGAMNLAGIAQGVVGVGLLALLYTQGRRLKAR